MSLGSRYDGGVMKWMETADITVLYCDETRSGGGDGGAVL